MAVAAANLALSQKRAEAIRDVLVKAGVPADMLVARGYGSADPIASNDDPQGRRRNRRIEYHIAKARRAGGPQRRQRLGRRLRLDEIGEGTSATLDQRHPSRKAGLTHPMMADIEMKLGISR